MQDTTDDAAGPDRLCSLCDRPVDPAAPYPLCSRCEGTARAVAKQMTNVTRTPVDYHDRRFG